MGGGWGGIGILRGERQGRDNISADRLCNFYFGSCYSLYIETGMCVWSYLNQHVLLCFFENP